MNPRKRITGTHGYAEQVEVAPLARSAQTLDYWVVTAPWAHPLWNQYIVGCVLLQDDVPGFPPPKRQFEGTTHEINVVALNPEAGPMSAGRITAQIEAGQGVKHLTPVNHACQFIATDEEMLKLTEAAAQGIIDAVLNPEVGDAPDRIREEFLTSLIKTLAHIRGEEHAP